MTCHSLLVLLVTPVPLVISPSLDVEVDTLHKVPNQATPTSEPSLQSVNKCHRPAPSDPPLLPLHCEKAESRLLSDSAEEEDAEEEDEGHAVFQGKEEEATLGQLPFTT